MPENCCFGLFSSPFHPRTINTSFFFLGFLGKKGRWENTSHGVSLFETFPFFSFSFFKDKAYFLEKIFFRVAFLFSFFF